jgi:hypothetical protein
MSQLSQEGVTLRGGRLNRRSGIAGHEVDQALHIDPCLCQGPGSRARAIEVLWLGRSVAAGPGVASPKCRCIRVQPATLD